MCTGTIIPILYLYAANLQSVSTSTSKYQKVFWFKKLYTLLVSVFYLFIVIGGEIRDQTFKNQLRKFSLMYTGIKLHGQF